MISQHAEHHRTTLEILRLFRNRGASQYGNEPVSQQEHALQAAMFAERAGADSALITAALLHDIGHLLHDLPNDAPERGIDDHHETLAGRWLEVHFGPEVAEPARMHVAAKRYLCTTEVTYRDQLSPASILSLKLQGGTMTESEVTAFRTHPQSDAAVALRRWDDAAKVPNLATPTLENFASHLDRVLRGDSPGAC